MKKVTLEDVDRRLKSIEKLLNSTLPELRRKEETIIKDTRLLRAEQAVIEEEERIITLKEEQLKRTEDALLKLLGERIPRKFDNILDWKRYIWEGCPHKKGEAKDKVIDYWCTKLNAACRFDPCPLNR
ncbi:hypothetical protein J4439_02155 [Candidatus Woesearchaeota archaeon]|nr:hypothetical protein [Candidatus Woesearchaeota archaeon]